MPAVELIGSRSAVNAHGVEEIRKFESYLCQNFHSGDEAMEKKFASDEIPLSQILNQAATGELQLPDFQRSWVWDDDHIVSLLASISLSYPIGAIMTLQTGNPDVRFRPRPLEGVVIDGVVEPDLLLLDGQQRTTSLFLALKSPDPVLTRDARGGELQRHYYADINLCIDPDIDREEGAIVGVDETRRQMTDFGRVAALDLSTRDLEIAAEHFPLDIVINSDKTFEWQFAYVQDGPGGPADQSVRFEKWRTFHDTFLRPFVQYQVPAIQLAKSTPKEAVCQVFEKVNTGGVSLSVFELLTATFAADDFNLRDDWNEREAAFDAYPTLARFEDTDFLQIVALLASYDRRISYLKNKPDGDKPPAVSCKRRDILRLTLDEYQQWADVAQKAVEAAVPFLHAEHIFKARDLPYATQLVPLAAILAALGPKADSHSVRQALRQWFWCGVFGEMYGGSTETRFANDLQDVIAWIRHNESEPRTVRDAQFQAERLLSLRSRNSAAYKGLYAIQMQRGGQDFRTGNRIDVHAYFDHQIDIHHIFPQKWCSDNGVNRELADCVVNKTAIDAHTNRRIGGNAPSQYLARIEKNEGIDQLELDEFVRSHDIDAALLRVDDFEGFFSSRFERLIKQIEEAMGKKANRAPDLSDNPFLDTEMNPERFRRKILSLLETGESRVTEFKSTARKNLHTGDRDPNIEWAVVKTIAAFMNTSGGTLLIGVADDSSIVGIEHDYPFVGGSDVDGWELWLTQLVNKALGKVEATELDVQFCALDDGTVARIDVGPSPEPVFASSPKGNGRSVFYVRTGNSTEECYGPDLLAYKARRWPL